MPSLRRALDAHLNAAKGYAKLSHAKRLKVGAVLVYNGRIISVGYNGTPQGDNNECEEVVKITTINVLKGGRKMITRTKPEVIHAEMNAIAFAARSGVRTLGCIMVTTHSPCFECAKLLFQSGVQEVYYEEEYRDTTSLDFLRSRGILVEKISNVQKEEASE